MSASWACERNDNHQIPSWDFLAHSQASEGLQCVYIVYINHFRTPQSVAGTLTVKISCNVLFPWWKGPLTKYISALPRTWLFREQICPLPSCFKWPEEWEDSDTVKWARNQTEIQTLVPDDAVMLHQCRWFVFPVTTSSRETMITCSHIGEQHISFGRHLNELSLLGGEERKTLLYLLAGTLPLKFYLISSENVQSFESLSALHLGLCSTTSVPDEEPIWAWNIVFFSPAIKQEL